MRLPLTFLFALSFFACQKSFEPSTPDSIALTVSDDALTPLPCHSTSFVTNHTIKPGEVPPFKFTKTLYPDTRVKTINMLSRVYPIHSAFKKHAYELIGTFTYSTNAAKFVGTRQTWEYYKTATGTAARRSILKRNINYAIHFNKYGHAAAITETVGVDPIASTQITYGYELDPTWPTPNSIVGIYVSTATEGDMLFAVNDRYGNLLSFQFAYDRAYPSYSYDYTFPRGSKNYSFIPSQNLISQEYSLLEVMQWLPQATHQRKTVSGTFYYGAAQTKVVQSQTYKNYKFDTKGNEISVTYADNVLQKTTWFCK